MINITVQDAIQFTIQIHYNLIGYKLFPDISPWHLEYKQKTGIYWEYLMNTIGETLLKQTTAHVLSDLETKEDLDKCENVKGLNGKNTGLSFNLSLHKIANCQL